MAFDFVPAISEQLNSEVFGAKMLEVECDVLLLLLLLLLLRDTCSTISRAARNLARKCFMFLIALYTLIASANKFQSDDGSRAYYLQFAAYAWGRP